VVNVFHLQFYPPNIPGTHIIIIFVFNTFIKDIYNYIPEKNMFPLYSVAAVPYSQFVLHVITHVTYVGYFHISTFRSGCAVHSWLLSAVLDVVFSRYVFQTFSEGF